MQAFMKKRKGGWVTQIIIKGRIVEEVETSPEALRPERKQTMLWQPAIPTESSLGRISFEKYLERLQEVEDCS